MAVYCFHFFDYISDATPSHFQIERLFDCIPSVIFLKAKSNFLIDYVCENMLIVCQISALFASCGCTLWCLFKVFPFLTKLSFFSQFSKWSCKGVEHARNKEGFSSKRTYRASY